MNPSPLRLLDAELRRYGARRAMQAVLAIALLIATIVNVAQFLRAEQSIERYGNGTVPQSQLLDECIIDRNSQPITVDGDCIFGRETAAPQPGDTFVDVQYGEVVDRRPKIGATFSGTIAGIGGGFLFTALILAATFLAADFRAAGLSTLLTFEPRRWRVYLVKLLACAIGSALMLGIILAWTGLGQFLISAARGSTAGIDAQWIVDRLVDYGRVAFAVALAIAVSFAVTVVARQTVAAVGVFFGLFIAQNFVFATTWGEDIAKYNPIVVLFQISVNLSSDDALGLTLGSATVIALVWAVGLTTFGGWWFRRTELR